MRVDFEYSDAKGYWMSRRRAALAALAFVVSGMVELFGFIPYLFLLPKISRLKQHRTFLFAILALVPVVIYLPETARMFGLLLGFAGFNTLNSSLSEPGRYSLFGNITQISIISQFKPLLVAETVILGFGIFETYHQSIEVPRIVFYTALSGIAFLLFSSLIAFWFWLLPIGILYSILKQKNDLGAYMLVFGTSIAFLEITYAFSSNYLIFGNFGPLVSGIEGIRNSLQITSVMAAALAIILLFFLRYGNGFAKETMARTAGISLSIYLLLYFWFGMYGL